MKNNRGLSLVIQNHLSFILESLIPNNPLACHSGEGRNPAGTNTREADKTSRLRQVSRDGKTMLLSRFRGEFLIDWIPACAGMTQFCANGLFGLIENLMSHPGRHFSRAEYGIGGDQN